MGGNVGSDHRGRHVQANPVYPSWDVLWLLRGWLARSMYGASRGGGMCTCVDACLALFRLWHSGGAVCRVVKRCSWFAEVPERNVTSFAEEGKVQGVGSCEGLDGKAFVRCVRVKTVARGHL